MSGTSGTAVIEHHGEPAVIRMGNDIARNLAYLPAERAAVEVATHIEKFWEPRMIAELLSYGSATDMSPLLAAAARHLADDDYDHSEVAQPSG